MTDILDDDQDRAVRVQEDPSVAVLKIALLELTRQANEAEGARKILADALQEIEHIADDGMDYDRSDLSNILYLCRHSRVKLARNPTE